VKSAAKVLNASDRARRLWALDFVSLFDLQEERDSRFNID